MILFYNLLLSHLIGDYWFQTDKQCKQKNQKRCRSPFLYIHAAIIGLLAYLFSNGYASFGVWAIAIGASHLVIDLFKSYIKKYPLITFGTDQLAHIVILYVVSQMYLSVSETAWSQFSFLQQAYQVKVPTLLCAIVICCGMSNIIVKLALKRFHIDLPRSKDKELDKAGALIGNLERLICLTFVLLDQYEAMGFIIAAKSILRFRDYEHSKTEYVLAGSMLSLGIALICGMGLSFIWSIR